MACLESLCPVSYCQVVSRCFNVSINAQSTVENKFSDLSAASNVLSHCWLCPGRARCHRRYHVSYLLWDFLHFFGIARTHQHTYLQNLLFVTTSSKHIIFLCCRCYCFVFFSFSPSKLVRIVCLCEFVIFNGVCSEWDSTSVCCYGFDPLASDIGRTKILKFQSWTDFPSLRCA